MTDKAAYEDTMEDKMRKYKEGKSVGLTINSTKDNSKPMEQI
jgi:ribosomal protein L21E